MPIDARVRPLAAGRAAFGTGALLAAGPLCHLAGVTDNVRLARALGVAIFTTDALLIAAAVRASTGEELRRAAAVNAATDLAGAVLLFGFATRRHGTQQLMAAGAGISLAGGGMAWLNARRVL